MRAAQRVLREHGQPDEDAIGERLRESFAPELKIAGAGVRGSDRRAILARAAPPRVAARVEIRVEEPLAGPLALMSAAMLATSRSVGPYPHWLQSIARNAPSAPRTRLAA